MGPLWINTVCDYTGATGDARQSDTIWSLRCAVEYYSPVSDSRKFIVRLSRTGHANMANFHYLEVARGA